jgi:hypothetical protein
MLLSSAVNANKNLDFWKGTKYMSRFFVYKQELFYADTPKGQTVIERLKKDSKDSEFTPAFLPIAAAVLRL